MGIVLAQMISYLANILLAVILIWAITSWILSPYHPVRQFLDRIVEPMVAPIRRVMPSVGMLDLSPLILMILIELVSGILQRVLLSIR